ncbi:hypothetical protein PTKIN_Ptkin14bG0088200 [Pterospermum kingtungense]
MTQSRTSLQSPMKSHTSSGWLSNDRKTRRAHKYIFPASSCYLANWHRAVLRLTLHLETSLSLTSHHSMRTCQVYANICKHQGLPFRHPGNRYTWEHFSDVSNARLIAEQQIWAAVSEKAKNQAFNCTNGDVFTWKGLWKQLCKVFNIEFVPFDEKEQFDLVEMMKENALVWDKIVDEYGLLKTKMEDMITCFAAIKSVLNLELQLVSNMTKSREFGFFGYADTIKSIEMWVRRLQDMKIIP